MGFIEGLKKGLEAIKEGKIEQIDSGFLRQCSEAVLSARQTVLNTNSATSSGEEMFADSCGKILGAIAKYDLGVMHVTRAMESRYPPRRTPQQTTR